MVYNVAFLYKITMKGSTMKILSFTLMKRSLKKINNLLKLFNYATGFVAGKQVLEGLDGFQALFIAAIFGWRYKKNKKKV